MDRGNSAVKENLFRIILKAPKNVNGFVAKTKFIHCTTVMDFMAPEDTLVVSEIGLKKDTNGDIVNCMMDDKEAMNGTLVRIMGNTNKLSTLLPILTNLLDSWEDPVITSDRYSLVGISKVNGDVLFEAIKEYI